MDEKWNMQNRNKGYLKIHIAVNIKTKDILALGVTDENVHDGKMLTKLVNQVLDVSNSGPNTIKIRPVLADGAYDSNANFRYLEEKGITSGIKVMGNSTISSRNNRLETKETRLQLKD